MKFQLPTPPSVNNLYNNVPGRGRRKTEQYKGWLMMAGGMVTSQKVGQVLPPAPYYLDVWLFVPDINKRRDASNFVKAPEDLLATIFAFDDNDVVDVSSHKRKVEVGPAYCTVYLWPSNQPEERSWLGRLTGRLREQESP